MTETDIVKMLKNSSKNLSKVDKNLLFSAKLQLKQIISVWKYSEFLYIYFR